jgi:hypothetical protein
MVAVKMGRKRSWVIKEIKSVGLDIEWYMRPRK